MSLIIYFLRHGENTASRTGGYCGILDPDLTPAGYQMAEDFAGVYKSLPWAAVFSSPMRRAIATDAPLCKATGIGMPVATVSIVKSGRHGPLLHRMGDPSYLHRSLRQP